MNQCHGNVIYMARSVIKSGTGTSSTKVFFNLSLHRRKLTIIQTFDFVNKWRFTIVVNALTVLC